MNPPPPYTAGGNSPSPPKKELQLQGPRPASLKVSKDSHIKKPPRQPAHHARLPPAPATHHQPVIIYSVSPKIIHATVSDFMAIVQRLTSLSAASSGDISPAARLASIEKTSPTERDRSGCDGGGCDAFVGLGEGVEVGRPGILSPAPGTFPPIPAGFFSPASDPNMLSFLQELSPFWQGNGCGGGGFMASPSGLFSAPSFSPTPSIDLFNIFLDL